MAMDIGYLLVAKSELQRTADAAAMAASWQLADEGMFKGDPVLVVCDGECQVPGGNLHSCELRLQCVAGGRSEHFQPCLRRHRDRSPCANGPILMTALDLTDPSRFNAVTVRVRRSGAMNGLVPSFFAKALGVNGFVAEGTATAALSVECRWFPHSAQRMQHQDAPVCTGRRDVELLCAGHTEDNWCWDAEDAEIDCVAGRHSRSQSVPSRYRFARQSGTVDIGSNNNSTNDIARQILEGISPEDLEYHDGELKFDDNGELELNGDTGISAGVKDELESIKGEPRCIPIFRTVSGPGNNAMYTIVKFAGIRIMEVKLTGKMSEKRVIIQPCPMIAQGVIRGEIAGTSDLVFTPVRLVR